MTTHAKCPECGAEAELVFLDCRNEYWVECCWSSPGKPTEAEAWRAWDTVVGAYWIYRDTINAVGELAEAMEQSNGEEG